jgi:hypothetical protein
MSTAAREVFVIKNIGRKLLVAAATTVAPEFATRQPNGSYCRIQKCTPISLRNGRDTLVWRNLMPKANNFAVSPAVLRLFGPKVSVQTTRSAARGRPECHRSRLHRVARSSKQSVTTLLQAAERRLQIPKLGNKESTDLGPTGEAYLMNAKAVAKALRCASRPSTIWSKVGGGACAGEQCDTGSGRCVETGSFERG